MAILMRRCRWAVRVLAALAAATAPACFAPRQPDCAFSCAEPPHACPANYACGSDGLCHRQGGSGMCFGGPDDTADAGAGNDANVFDGLHDGT